MIQLKKNTITDPILADRFQIHLECAGYSKNIFQKFGSMLCIIYLTLLSDTIFESALLQSSPPVDFSEIHVGYTGHSQKYRYERSIKLYL